MVKGKWKRRIYFAGGSVLSLLNKMIPKDPKKILFFCRGELCDNSEVLFRYMKEQNFQEKYEIICAVENPELYRDLEEDKISFVNVFKSLKEIFLAKYIFCHGEMLAIKPSNTQISVNYWHGTPLKKINAMLDKLGGYDYEFFTWLTAPSEKFRPIMAEAFGCEEKKIMIAGHPRNDDLFSRVNDMIKLGIEKKIYKKIFIWLPTYRLSRDGLIQDTTDVFAKNGGIPLFHSEMHLEDLNEYMKKKQSLLLLKVHPAQDIKTLKLKKWSHVRVLTNKELIEKHVSLYKILKDTDALITDYSSAFFDYLLLDKPEAFIIEDYKDYENNRGFAVENTLDYMPGEKIKTIEEFYAFIEQCVEGKDDYQAQRHRVNEVANYYKDGNNCKRLLEKIGLFTPGGN